MLRLRHHSGVFIVNFEHISHPALLHKETLLGKSFEGHRFVLLYSKCNLDKIYPSF